MSAMRQVHGYMNGGDLVAFLLMIAGAVLAVVLAVVALGVMVADRSASAWWWSALVSFAVSFFSWLYL
jgi:uncharacterized membrane-anchored protein